MTIRYAVREDIPALLEIYNYEVMHSTATLDLTPRTLSEWEEWFSSHQTQAHFILTAVMDEMPVGYASLSKYRQKEAYSSTAELSVYVNHDYRRRGVADALIKQLLKYAAECQDLHSIVSVITSGNSASESLHRKYGFKFCGTLHEVGFKHGKYQDIDNYSLILNSKEIN